MCQSCSLGYLLIEWFQTVTTSTFCLGPKLFNNKSYMGAHIPSWWHSIYCFLVSAYPLHLRLSLISGSKNIISAIPNWSNAMSRHVTYAMQRAMSDGWPAVMIAIDHSRPCWSFPGFDTYSSRVVGRRQKLAPRGDISYIMAMASKDISRTR